MSDIYRTMVVTAANVALARGIAVGISPVAGADMWKVPASPTGQNPATVYWDSGFIGPEWGILMPLQTYDRDVQGNWVLVDSYPGQPQELLAICQQYGVQVTQQQIDDLFATSDVTVQQPLEALERMGLTTVRDLTP